jgi:hypothetical protein
MSGISLPVAMAMYVRRGGEDGRMGMRMRMEMREITV